MALGDLHNYNERHKVNMRNKIIRTMGVGPFCEQLKVNGLIN